MTAKKGPISKEEAGRWLREQRRRRGFETVGAFARALGVDPSRVSNYERGDSRVPDTRADQIAELLHMDVIHVRRNLGLWVPPESASSRPSPAASLAHAEEERDRWVEAMRQDPKLAKSFANLVAYALGRLAQDPASEGVSDSEKKDRKERPESDRYSPPIADRNKTDGVA
jgi:transcriptional regulator with XRE-family HTH domain